MRNPVKALCGFLAALVTIALLLYPSGALADVLVLDNGNEIRGKILKKTSTHYVVSLPFGRMDIPLRQVKEVRKEEDAEYLRESGQRLARSDDPGQGIALLREALKSNPDSPPCKEALVEGLARGAQKTLQSGDLQRATRWIEEAEQLDFESPLVKSVREELRGIERLRERLREEALIADQTQDFITAYETYQKLMARFPLERDRYRKPFARASLIMGHVRLDDEDFAGASQAYHDALANDPDLIPWAKSPLGYADVKQAIPLLEAGRYQHAVQLLNGTADLLVDEPAVLYHLGLAWEGSGNVEQAARIYEKLAGPERKTINAHEHLSTLRSHAERMVFRGKEETTVAQRWTKGKGKGAGIHETPHFRIHYYHVDQAREVSKHLEHHWQRYSKRWLRKVKGPEGKKVDIFLHPNHDEYLNRSSAPRWSHGVTQNESRYQVVVKQAVHFDASHPQFLTATLPHELVHVVLPYRLGSRELPKWLDEGLATAEEPTFKQRYFERVVSDADDAGTLFKLEQLFGMEEYPGPDRVALFYAQSNSIVRYLRKHLGDDGLLRWAEQLAADGLADAVKKGTRFSSVRSLEVAWKRDMVRKKRRKR